MTVYTLLYYVYYWLLDSLFWLVCLPVLYDAIFISAFSDNIYFCYLVCVAELHFLIIFDMHELLYANVPLFITAAWLDSFRNEPINSYWVASGILIANIVSEYLYFIITIYCSLSMHTSTPVWIRWMLFFAALCIVCACWIYGFKIREAQRLQAIAERQAPPLARPRNAPELQRVAAQPLRAIAEQQAQPHNAPELQEQYNPDAELRRMLSKLEREENFKVDGNDEKTVCCVCSENYANAMFVPCRHMHCRECATQILNSDSPICTICRDNVRDVHVGIFP